VEAEFIGKMVIDQLRQANVPVKAFQAKKYGDKEQRAVGAEIAMEAGLVWLPAGASFLGELQAELLGFPNGAHDDQVDAISQMVAVSQKYQGTAEEIVTPEEAAQRKQQEETERFNRLLWAGSDYPRIRR
jgi:phage terminase large subunit-like protein